jgi:hypothetical protein
MKALSQVSYENGLKEDNRIVHLNDPVIRLIKEKSGLNQRSVDCCQSDAYIAVHRPGFISVSVTVCNEP